MKKEKVFFISAANNIHTVRWVNALVEKYEIHLIYCKNHMESINKINKKVILHPLKIKAPYGYYLNLFELRRLYKKEKPDLINVHYASGYGTLTRVSKIKPVLLSIWGSDIYDFPKKSKLNKKILEKNIKFADSIASTSNVMADELKRQYPNFNKEINITPFGVDTTKFINKNIVRKDNEIRIGNIKALSVKYGIVDLIMAVKILRDNLIRNKEERIANQLKLYIYGDGPDKQNIMKIIKNNNLETVVFLMGRIANERVPEILNTLDIFCATSILNSESFGVAVVEAMSCELPVVVTDVDGFKEVVKNEETGTVVKKGNIEEISNALQDILSDKERAEKMGKNARERVIKLYNWEDNVNKMSKIYKKIIEKYTRKNIYGGTNGR